jgi:hypothetical protein
MTATTTQIQRKGGAPNTAAPAPFFPAAPVPSATTAQAIAAQAGQGETLPETLQQELAPHYQVPLDEVRLHTGDAAAGLSAQLQAKAFATGRDIYFGAGAYQPHTSEGKHLLAHELTHVQQQASGQAAGTIQRQPAAAPAPAAPTPAPGYPAGYNMTDTQRDAEHLRDMRDLTLNIMLSGELVTLAREMQTRLDAHTTPDVLQFELARSLLTIESKLTSRAAEYMLMKRTETIFGEQDDIATALGSPDAPLWGIEGFLGEPFDSHHSAWRDMVQNGVRFREPGSQKTLADRNPKLSTRLRNGAKTPAATEYRLAPYAASLFSRGPSDLKAIDPNDVSQDQLSDCYFLASVAAVAQTHPDSLANLIHDNGDGTYNVTLYVNGDKLTTSSPKMVKVYPDVPTNAEGRQKYANIQSGNEVEIWVQLLEKAFATLRGSYARLDTGGEAHEGMFALTGKKGKYYSNPSLSIADIRTRIQEALSNNWPIVAGTPSGKHPLRVSYDIANWHMYYIIGFKMMDDNMLEMGNPWGTGNLTGDEAVPLNVFKQAFHGFTVLRDYTGTP